MTGLPGTAPVRHGQRQRGFTILELLLVTVVVSAVLVLCARVQLQSFRLTAAVMTPLLRADLQLGEALLRNDVQRAVAASSSPFWTSLPLELDLGTTRVTWTSSEGRLVRIESSGEEETAPLRRELVPVDAFRWRGDGRTLRIELTPTEPRMSGAAGAVERGLFAQRRPRHEWLLTARNADGSRW